MKIEYWTEYDMLSIRLSDAKQAHGHNAEDPDVVVHFDESNRLTEVEISNASARVDLDSLRKLDVFVEVKAEEVQA